MKKNKELIFIAIGIFLLLVAGVIVFYSLNFLVKNIDLALNVDTSENRSVTRLNFEGLKNLGIIE